MDLSAVGVPVTDVAEGWNFWPLVGIPLALFVAFRWLHLPRTVWVAAAAFMIGLLSADAVEAWGVAPVAGVGACLVAVASIALGRRPGGHPPTV